MGRERLDWNQSKSVKFLLGGTAWFIAQHGSFTYQQQQIHLKTFREWVLIANNTTTERHANNSFVGSAHTSFQRLDSI